MTNPTTAWIEAYLAGRESAPITLMNLLLLLGSVAATEEMLRDAESAARAGNWPVEPLTALHQLFDEHRTGILELAAIMQNETEIAKSDGVPGDLAACRAMFDRLVRQQAEASVALYSFGSSSLLARCTDEIVSKLEEWQLIGRDRRILDLGCGFGRIAAALAPKVAEVMGLDLSPEMIAEARRRHRDLGNVRFVEGSGSDLRPAEDDSCDLIIAVDSFPYIVQCGAALVERHFAEARRVLRQGGDLLLLNFSYRGDLATDRAEIARLAQRHGFRVIRNGRRCLPLWDGLAFQLQLA